MQKQARTCSQDNGVRLCMPLTSVTRAAVLILFAACARSVPKAGVAKGERDASSHISNGCEYQSVTIPETGVRIHTMRRLDGGSCSAFEGMLPAKSAED